jgi:hypothetical protein
LGCGALLRITQRSQLRIPLRQPSAHARKFTLQTLNLLLDLL